MMTENEQTDAVRRLVKDALDMKPPPDLARRTRERSRTLKRQRRVVAWSSVAALVAVATLVVATGRHNEPSQPQLAVSQTPAPPIVISLAPRTSPENLATQGMTYTVQPGNESTTAGELALVHYALDTVLAESLLNEPY